MEKCPRRRHGRRGCLSLQVWHKMGRVCKAVTNRAKTSTAGSQIAPVIDIHEEHPQSLVLFQTRVKSNVAVL